MLVPDMLKPGDNPRQTLPRHRERGAVLHQFTLAELAEAAGVNYQTIRKAVSDGRLLLKKKEGGGFLDPEELRSLVSYVARALALKGQPLDVEKLPSVLPPEQMGWWANRWPRFDLFRCQYPTGCDVPLFDSGLCSEHGGARKPALTFDADWNILVLLDGTNYVPLARLVSQAPAGMHTHHRDGNPWNNRWENLEALSREEHEERHVGSLLTAPVVKNQPARRPFRSEKLDGVVLSKATLQKYLDEAYLRGLAAGRKKT